MVFDMNALHNGTVLQPIIHKKGYKVVVVLLYFFYIQSRWTKAKKIESKWERKRETINIIAFTENSSSILAKTQ